MGAEMKYEVGQRVAAIDGPFPLGSVGQVKAVYPPDGFYAYVVAFDRGSYASMHAHELTLAPIVGEYRAVRAPAPEHRANVGTFPFLNPGKGRV